MENKVNYTIVGLFVILLTAGIIFIIIWLSAGVNNKNYHVYRVFMAESVNGLNLDSLVKFNGVEVGTVKNIQIDKRNPLQVDLLLNIEDGTPITNCTTAILTSQGLTGVAFIDLKNTAQTSLPLVAKPGQKYPVLKSAPSLFLRLDKTINDLSENFSSLTTALELVLTEKNRENFSQTLENLNKVTSTLANNSKQFTIIMQNTANASKEFPELLHNSQALIQNGQTSLQTLKSETLPKVTQILNSLQKVSDNLVDTSRTIKQNPAVLIRGQTPPRSGPGE